nr:hypothetical protein Iba_chr03fCG1920 [Ipomoea batatas]
MATGSEIDRLISLSGDVSVADLRIHSPPDLRWRQYFQAVSLSLSLSSLASPTLYPTTARKWRKKFCFKEILWREEKFMERRKWAVRVRRLEEKAL